MMKMINFNNIISHLFLSFYFFLHLIDEDQSTLKPIHSHMSMSNGFYPSHANAPFITPSYIFIMGVSRDHNGPNYLLKVRRCGDLMIRRRLCRSQLTRTRPRANIMLLMMIMIPTFLTSFRYFENSMNLIE